MAQAIKGHRENLAIRSSDDLWSKDVGVINRGIFSVFLSCDTYHVWSEMAHSQSALFFKMLKNEAQWPTSSEVRSKRKR